MKKLKLIVASLALVLGIGGGLLVAAPNMTSAVSCSGAKDCFDKGIGAVDNNKDSEKGDSLTTLIRNIINILLFLAGIAAVIMIIIGGIRYVTSSGDQSQVTAAKNTILYAVIGLVVAALAFAIVNFITDRL